MRDDLDDIEKDPTGDDTSSSNSFLKIEPIKNLDISNIKIETETKTEEPKKSPDKQTKEDIPQNDKPVKDNSKIIKIGIAVLIVILCLVGGYFAYSKFMASDKSEELADNTVTEEVMEETPEETVTEENTNTVEEPSSEENSVQVNDDNYDLVVLDKVYDEVINKGNEAYLNNFSSDELAIIRNTLYARNVINLRKKNIKNILEKNLGIIQQLQVKIF